MKLLPNVRLVPRRAPGVDDRSRYEHSRPLPHPRRPDSVAEGNRDNRAAANRGKPRLRDHCGERQARISTARPQIHFLISVPKRAHALASSLDHPSKCRKPPTHVCLKRFVTGQTAFSLGTVITSRITPTLRDSERGSDSAHT